MSNAIAQFTEKKKANSEYISLADGESIRIKRVLEFKQIIKAGFAGEEKDALRMTCEIETMDGLKTKKFDNSTMRWAEELTKNKVDIGDSFTLTRTGLSTKTRYTISDLVKPTTAAPVNPLE